MKIEDLTIEMLDELSQEEVFMWADVFARDEKEKQLRKLMKDSIEVKEAKGIIE